MTGLPAISRVGTGRDHTLAITTTGALWAWGLDDFGQLGDGGTANQLRPKLIAGITDAADAAGGRGYTVLLRTS